jgi:hypothetical protein
MQKPSLSEIQRLQLICEALAFSRSASKAGSPIAAHARAVREAIYELWESYGRSKAASAKWRSRASLAPIADRNGHVYDHAIPFTLVHRELLEVSDLSPEAIRPILEARVAAALITRREDEELTRIGLRSKMPSNWDGVNVLARYEAAGIEVIENIGETKRREVYAQGSEAASDRRELQPNESLILSLPDEHPKLQASSPSTRSAWETIWTSLQAEGFRLVPDATRDGFYVATQSGFRFKIDPKANALRIKIGLRPLIPPPTQLVHNGNQRDWIEVKPEHYEIAAAYLRQLTGSACAKV